MKKALLSFVFLIGVFSASAQNSLLWKVEAENGEVSYLYGTYHLLGADYFQEKPQVTKAYQSARMVVVETVIDSSQIMQLATLSLMPGKSLKAMTDSMDYIILKEKLEPVIGMDLAIYDMVKPMALTTAYIGAIANELTPDSLKYGGLPMDLHFAKNAKSEGKTVMQLETMREQFEMLFNSKTVEEQLEELLEMVKEEDDSGEILVSIIQSYFQNDLDGLYKASMEWEYEPEEMEILIDNRNLNWIPKLEPELNKGGLFIAVGALHLPGEKGVITLLQEKGFKLTPLN